MNEPHQLRVLSFGFSLGICFGAYVFLLGVSAWLLGWGVEIVKLISSLYKGYAPSFGGSVIGALWGFFDGFIGGIIIAWLYNRFQKKV